MRTFLFVLLMALPVVATTTPLADVGIAAVDIEPSIGGPLAGYGATVRRYPGLVDWKNETPGVTYFKQATGRHSPIRSKAMVIRAGGELVAFVSVDFVGVEREMTSDLAERLERFGITPDRLVFSGTHTHHGPGATSRRFVLEVSAVDKFHPDIYDSILDKVEESVELAVARLAPAELLSASFETDGLQRNKFRRLGENHYDANARVLFARRPDGDYLGGIVNYALHGNGMPVGDLRFSSDVLGQIELNMERVIAGRNADTGHEPVVLFVNGAEGDVGNPVRTEAAVMSDGIRFAEQAVRADLFARLQPVTPQVSVRREKVWLGMPGRSPKICAREGSFLDRYGLGLRIPLPFLFPQSTYLSAIRIGDILMLTVPGEASTQVGYDLQDAIMALGHERPWLLGLANDYMAYFTTREEYWQGHYDSCSSLFSWKGADRIKARYVKILAGDGARSTVLARQY